MNLIVNDKTFEFEDNASINLIIEKTNSPQNGIAVAINDTVIPKSEWKDFKLSENDNILIIKAAQGG